MCFVLIHIIHMYVHTYVSLPTYAAKQRKVLPIYDVTVCGSFMHKSCCCLATLLWPMVCLPPAKVKGGHNHKRTTVV